jgi:hypothetical protein
MPADVSFQDVGQRSVSVETSAERRFPLGIGLMIAAFASVGLWIAIVAGVRALMP